MLPLVLVTGALQHHGQTSHNERLLLQIGATLCWASQELVLECPATPSMALPGP